MPELTIEDLQSCLEKASKILVDTNKDLENENYIFELLFLKRINDQFIEIKSKDSAEIIDEDLYLSVPEKARWKNIQSQTKEIGLSINQAFKDLEANNDGLEGILSSTDFTSIPDDILKEIINLFSELQLADSNLNDRELMARLYPAIFYTDYRDLIID